jgi:hypothetical protein
MYYKSTGGCTGDYVGGRWDFLGEHWVFIKEGLSHEFGDSTNKTPKQTVLNRANTVCFLSYL